MARSGFAAFLFALCFHGSLAAQLVEKSNVVRREPHSVQLNPRGDLIQAGSKPEGATSGQDKGDKLCNIDFHMGNASQTPLQKQCLPWAGRYTGSYGNNALANQKMDREECHRAGSIAGATTTQHNFDVPQKTNDYWEYKHPQGCFKDKCPEGETNGICYYFNDVDDQSEVPASAVAANITFEVTGEIVCPRPDHQEGATNDNDGCPHEYSVIDNQTICKETASCLGYEIKEQDFVIGHHNASKHLDYPRGCFWIQEHDGSLLKKIVYFNPESPLGAGTNVKGTVLCNVTSRVQWAAGATHDPASGGHVAASSFLGGIAGILGR